MQNDRKIPYAVLGERFVTYLQPLENLSRWLPRPPAFLFRPGFKSAREALEDAGFFPWGEAIYSAYGEEIESTYRKAKSAFFISAAPDVLQLIPITVEGGVVDWDNPYPDDDDDLFSSPFAPALGGLPPEPAFAPERVAVVRTMVINPWLDDVPSAYHLHPAQAAAFMSVNQKIRNEFTPTEDSRHPPAPYETLNLTGLESPDYLLPFMSTSVSPHDQNDRTRELLVRYWDFISSEIAAGRTAIGFMRSGVGPEIITAKPLPAKDEPTTVHLPFMFKALAGKARFKDVVNDMLIRREVSQFEVRFAVLIRDNDPRLEEKLHFLKSIYPSSRLYSQIDYFPSVIKKMKAQGAVVFDRGPDLKYKTGYVRHQILPEDDWRDEIFIPPHKS